MIEAYFPGFDIFCPRCKSSGIMIIFDDGFLGINRGKWKEKIRSKEFQITDDIGIIKSVCAKNSAYSVTNPIWLCKICKNAGVVIDQL